MRASAPCARCRQRYHVDLAQAERVEQTALGLLAQVAETWQLDDPLAELAAGAGPARLHEIGLDVAHSRLPPARRLPARERRHARLRARGAAAARAASSAATGASSLLEGFDELCRPGTGARIYLIVLLRLAVLLHRGRSGAAAARS